MNSQAQAFTLYETNMVLHNARGNDNNFHIRRKITFDRVSYSFDGENNVLNNLNLELEMGKNYAIVGQSGCGKSTLINLLCRFYETDMGIISVDSQNIKQINLDTFRRRVGLISQENMLFHDSVLENIGYGKANRAIAAVEKVAKISGIHGYVKSLNDGFNSMIGDKGTNLSGGQKQRIAIARAILKEVDMIILDEATSGLDSESEKKIFDELVKIYKDKAMIFISHRLSTVKDVDEIICIHEGRIIEKGNFEELISKRGFYWKLFQNQIE